MQRNKPPQKKFSLAVEGLRKFFANAPANSKIINRMQDVLSSSTNNRIII